MSKKHFFMGLGLIFVIACLTLLSAEHRGNPLRLPEGLPAVENPEAEARGPCYWLGYWGTPTYYWIVPNPLGDLAYAERFTVCRPETLKYVDITIYDDESGLCGNDTVFCTIYDDDGYGGPCGLIAQVAIPPGAYSFFPAWTTFDFTPLNLVMTCDFHVAFSSSATTTSGDYECILSDDGSKNLRRSNVILMPCVFYDMFTYWGSDVNFVFDVCLCPSDNFDDEHKMHFPQYPDEAGWDVNASYPIIVADDWQCSQSGFIRDIHFWGSWLDDDIGTIDSFLLSIHEDIPAGGLGGTCYNDGDCNQDGVALAIADFVELVRYLTDVPDPRPFFPWYDFNGDCVIDDLDADVFNDYFEIGLPAFDPFGGYPIPTCCEILPYSRPGDAQWESFINEFVVVPFESPDLEGWYDPSLGIFVPGNHWSYFRYDVCLPEDLWFWQVEDSIYWLNISAILADTGNQRWGWKTSLEHWNDYAVWSLLGELDWVELEDSLDMAFVITPGFCIECDCEPGNSNGDATINILDITFLISHLYKEGPPPIPYLLCSGDANCDCTVNILDITYLISFLYKEGPVPCTCEDWLAACGPPLRK